MNGVQAKSVAIRMEFRQSRVPNEWSSGKVCSYKNGVQLEQGVPNEWSSGKVCSYENGVQLELGAKLIELRTRDGMNEFSRSSTFLMNRIKYYLLTLSYKLGTLIYRQRQIQDSRLSPSSKQGQKLFKIRERKNQVQ